MLVSWGSTLHLHDIILYNLYSMVEIVGENAVCNNLSFNGAYMEYINSILGHYGSSVLLITYVIVSIHLNYARADAFVITLLLMYEYLCVQHSG